MRWRAALGVSAAVTAAASCTIDFDRFDPTLNAASSAASGGATASSSTTGGAGGAVSSSSSGAGGCVPGEPEVCYDGPDGTQGIGSCRGGVRICQPDGESYGPCMGSVEPILETCGSVEDDDCDGVANDHCGESFGVFGSTSTQQVIAARSAPGDGVFVVGNYDGSLDFGSGSVSANAGAGGYALRLGADMSEVFFYTIDGPGASRVVDGLALDTASYVVVEFAGTVSPGGGLPSVTSQSVDDGLIVKLDASHNPEWAVHLRSTSNVDFAGMAEGADGAIYVGGFFTGTTEFGYTPGGGGTGGGGTGGAGGGGGAMGSGGSGPGPSGPTATASSEDGFVLRLDPGDGSVDWVQTIGTSGNDQVLDLAVDAQGDLLVAGQFDTEAAVGTGATPLVQDGGTDGFVAKVSPAGAAIWAHKIGGTGNARVNWVATDASGAVWAAGNFAGQFDANGATPMAVDGDDAFVRKITSAGAEDFTRLYGGVADQSARNIVLRGNEMRVGVVHAGSADYGLPQLVQSAGQSDMLVLALDDAGDTLWARQFGDAINQSTVFLVPTGAGPTWIAGTCAGMVDFGDGFGDTAGSSDGNVCIGRIEL